MAFSRAVFLIVDDEPDLVEILRDRFEIFGFQTQGASTVVEAKKILEKEKIDLVMTDIRMPGESGLELLTWIKSRNPEKPPVFLISGFAGDYNVSALLNQGADGFFSKPFDSNQIRERAQSALLPIRSRWGVHGRYSPEREFNLNMPDLAAAESQNKFRLGRRGFCVEVPPIDLGTGVLKYDINFGGKERLRGCGRISWAEKSQAGTRFAGIEILTIDKDDFDYWVSKIENASIIASIPTL